MDRRFLKKATISKLAHTSCGKPKNSSRAKASENQPIDYREAILLDATFKEPRFYMKINCRKHVMHEKPHSDINRLVVWNLLFSKS